MSSINPDNKDQVQHIAAQNATHIKQKAQTQGKEETAQTKAAEKKGMNRVLQSFDSVDQLAQSIVNKAPTDAQFNSTDKRHMINLMQALALAMTDIFKGDQDLNISGSARVQVDNTELKNDNAKLQAILPKINHYIQEMQNPPSPPWWGPLVGIAVGLLVGVGLSIALPGIGEMIGGTLDSSIDEGVTAGVDESFTALEEESSTDIDESLTEVSEESSTDAGAAGSGSSRLQRLGQWIHNGLDSSMGRMMTVMMGATAGEQIGSQQDQEAQARITEKQELYNAELAKLQTVMQDIMNLIQQAENKASNCFKLEVSNPQSQNMMASQEFSSTVSNMTNTTSGNFSR